MSSGSIMCNKSVSNLLIRGESKRMLKDDDDRGFFKASVSSIRGGFECISEDDCHTSEDSIRSKRDREPQEKCSMPLIPELSCNEQPIHEKATHEHLENKSLMYPFRLFREVIFL